MEAAILDAGYRFSYVLINLEKEAKYAMKELKHQPASLSNLKRHKENTYSLRTLTLCSAQMNVLQFELTDLENLIFLHESGDACMFSMYHYLFEFELLLLVKHAFLMFE